MRLTTSAERRERKQRRLAAKQRRELGVYGERSFSSKYFFPEGMVNPDRTMTRNDVETSVWRFSAAIRAVRFVGRCLSWIHHALSNRG